MLIFYQECNWGLFDLSVLNCKISAKNDLYNLQQDTCT